MDITLIPVQQNLVQAKLLTGKYRSTEQVIELALRLLEAYEQADSEWSQATKEEIEAATAISTPANQKSDPEQAFFELAGLWENKDITVESLRAEAW